ncbi:hypothetical protein GCM10027092_20390 [Yaniella soli]
MPTRQAAELTGVSRASMHRAAQPEPVGSGFPASPAEPANKLSNAERDEVLAVLHSDRFVD